MQMVEIIVPSPGESISEVEIGKWLVVDGSLVKKDQELAEVESDKATLSLIATISGKIHILSKEGDRVKVGSVACTILPSNEITNDTIVAKEETKTLEKVEIVNESSIISPSGSEQNEEAGTKISSVNIKMTPTAKAMMEQANFSIEEVVEGIKRLNRSDMERIIRGNDHVNTPTVAVNRTENRVAMTPLRKKLSQRLVSVKNETAMLTTFNEVDMSSIHKLRNLYQSAFTEKYGIKLGFNAFFAKAVSIALKQYPSINSMIDGEFIVTPEYHDIGIAVASPKGLMVPIIRNVETLELSQIELSIKELADKARDKRLSVQEMTGGTFTITNGGVFGSMMSTPIINPPQSAILGLHAIKERPVAIEGKVEIRPMMYLALSYDHRIIDGKDSVGFLVAIKNLIETPTKLLYQGKSAESKLLGL